MKIYCTHSLEMLEEKKVKGELLSRDKIRREKDNNDEFTVNGLNGVHKHGPKFEI
jgi:hypothetical protein